MLLVKNSTPISFAQAKTILDKKNEDNLGHEQKITIDYLRKKELLDLKIAQELEKELHEKVPILKDYQIIAIINLMPKDVDDINTLFMKERINLTKEQIEEILKIVK
jgi:DNA-directed RNA polymerase subunit F